MNNKKAVLVDDHPLFRSAIKSLLNEAAVQVVGEFSGEQDCLKTLIELNPDLMVIDISLQEGNGIDLVKKAKLALPEVKILMLSMHSDFQQIVGSFQAGAKGYIQKGASSYEIIRAIEAIMVGNTYLDSTLSPSIISQILGKKANPNPVQNDPYDLLTNREQEVFKLVAQGFETKKIATLLGIKLKTVENHRSAIIKKMKFSNIVEWVQAAIRLGVIVIDD